MHALRSGVLDLLAHLEAGFDFADEELPFITREQLTARLDEAAGEVDRLVGRMAARGETVESARVVLRGRPNAGKSSLFNAMADRAGALVSHEPGTTRDYLTATLDLDGVKCQLIDTAGIESADGQATDAAGAIGQAAEAAAVEQSRRATVTLLCVDSTRPVDTWLQQQIDAGDDRQIVVFTKTDVAGRGLAPLGLASESIVETSSMTGAGLRPLRNAIRRAILHARGPQGDIVAGTAVRAGESLRLAAECLGRARRMAHDGHGEELVAVEIRVALDELGKVVGTVYTEDVLERIFSRFCVGK